MGGRGAAGVGGRCAVRSGTAQPGTVLPGTARHGTASAMVGGFCTAAVTEPGFQRGRALGAAGRPEPRGWAGAGAERSRPPAPRAAGPAPGCCVPEQPRSHPPAPNNPVPITPSPLPLFPHHPGRGSPISIPPPQSPPCSLLLKELRGKSSGSSQSRELLLTLSGEGCPAGPD